MLWVESHIGERERGEIAQEGCTSRVKQKTERVIEQMDVGIGLKQPKSYNST